jgi:hypothetical protein
MGQQNDGGYDNEMRFALFDNQRKEEGDRKPDMTGRIQINGEEFYLSGWWREGRGGNRFLSGAVQSKAEVDERRAVAQEGRGPARGGRKKQEEPGGLLG